MSISLAKTDWLKAVVIGLVNGLLLSAVMVPLFKAGISPFPKPVGLAFAETLLGPGLPLPVGLAFHLAYVTFWCVAFVAVLRHRLTLVNALLLALALWVVAVAVFFPVVGWGFLGLGVGPKLPVAALLPHALFGVFLWGLCRIAFRPSRASG